MLPILPIAAYLFAYLILYNRITGNFPPTNLRFLHTALEMFAAALIAGVLETTFFSVGTVFLLLTIYFSIRLYFELQPARDERSRNDRQIAAEQRAAEERNAAELRQRVEAIAPFVFSQVHVNQKHILIGKNIDSWPIGYLEKPGQEERFRHTYIIGASGYGKTTCLCNLIAQDIFHGNGVIVLSSEEDFFPKLLSYIPESRMDDLIYFDPADTTPPIIGFNPFTRGAGEDLDQKIGETRTILKRAMGKDMGHTMIPMIDNVLSVLVQRPNATFADVMQLLNPANKTVRNPLRTDLTLSEEERDFWQQYDNTMYYRNSYSAVYNRFSPFAKSPISTTLATSSFSFKTVMNNGHHIIFLDLSQLRDTEPVTMGQLLLASIEQALLTRNPDDKSLIPYHLYIDEFQLYAEDSKDTFIKLFNGARKRRLGINIAHQTTANIPPELMKTITQNAGTKIVMHLSADDSPFFAKQLQLESPIYLQNLKEGEAYVQTPSINIGIPTTLPATANYFIPLPIPTPAQIQKIVSKENFGSKQHVPRVEVEPEQPAEQSTPKPKKKRSFGVTLD